MCELDDPLKLVACYGHLTGTMPPAVPNVCHSTLRTQRIKRILTPLVNYKVDSDNEHLSPPSPLLAKPNDDDDSSSPHKLNDPIQTCLPSTQLHVSMCACSPPDHGTFALVGLLRGLIYWRLMTNQLKLFQTLEVLDQFGTHVSTSSGLGISVDNVALLVSLKILYSIIVYMKV